MKKIVLPILMILVIVLSACGSAPAVSAAQVYPATTQVSTTAQTSVGAGSANTVNLNTSYTNALSIENQLLLGTFKLEDTDQAVTADQAKVLLPLWQQVQTLSPSMGPGQGGPSQGQAGATPTAQASNSSDTQTQIDALVKQIQAAMASDQIQTIAAMNLTQDSVSAILKSQGLSIGGPGGGTESSQQPPLGTPPAGNGQAAQGNPPSGNVRSPQSNPPSGDGLPPVQGKPQTGNTQSALQGAPSGQGNFMPLPIISALVQLLQNRIAGKASQNGATSTTSAAAPNGSTPSNSFGNSSASTKSAAYSLNSGSASLTGQTYMAANKDESAVYISNSGNLTLTNSTVTTTGNTSSTDASSFVGLNAGMLVASGGTLNLSNSQVTTSGTGANGVLSTGSGSTVMLSNDQINATGDGGHAVMATQGGTMNLTNVDMTTSGGSSSAIATDRGGGTITVTGGTVKTSGNNSAGIYSTGNITVANTAFTSTGAEAAVIEGGNSITLNGASLTSTKAGKWGVMIYQSMSGDAQGTKGTFSMTGSSLADTATDSPLFYVNNSTAVINLKGVTLNAASGILVNAAAGSWGTSGSNGGTVILTADGQTMVGNLVADSISSINVTLQNGSSLTGSINSAKTAKAADLTMDASSSWNVTADSYLASFSDANGISGTTITNITGNGHTVYYDASLPANSSLGGKTYNLNERGTLKPFN